MRAAGAFAAFAVLVGIVAVVVVVASSPVRAEPLPCRWRVTRDKVSVSGGAAAFVASEDGEPFGIERIDGPGEQWAVFVRTCSR